MQLCKKFPCLIKRQLWFIEEIFNKRDDLPNILGQLTILNISIKKKTEIFIYFFIINRYFNNYYANCYY